MGEHGHAQGEKGLNTLGLTIFTLLLACPVPKGFFFRYDCAVKVVKVSMSVQGQG